MGARKRRTSGAGPGAGALAEVVRSGQEDPFPGWTAHTNAAVLDAWQLPSYVLVTFCFPMTFVNPPWPSIVNPEHKRYESVVNQALNNLR